MSAYIVKIIENSSRTLCVQTLYFDFIIICGKNATLMAQLGMDNIKEAVHTDIYVYRMVLAVVSFIYNHGQTLCFMMW